MTASQTTSASYEVGYRKPPRHTQFQKGQSGNPGGRPRRPARRHEDLALSEAYRSMVVIEDGRAEPMVAIQVVLRRQLQSAAGGNARAQRDVLAMIRDIERIRSYASLFDNGDADDDVDDADDDANDGADDDVDDDAGADDGDHVHDIDDDDNNADDAGDADRDDADGADDDESTRQQADGIDTDGERREEEREPTAPTLPPDPGSAGVSPASRKRAGGTPALPGRGSGSGQRRGVRRHNGPGRSAGVPARPQPGRRRRSPAVNAAKIPGGRSSRSRRSPGRAKSGPGPAQAAGGHARTPATSAERGEKLKIPC